MQNRFVLSNYSNTLQNMTSGLEFILQVIGYIVEEFIAKD